MALESFGEPMFVLKPAVVKNLFGGKRTVDQAEVYENGMRVAWKDGEATLVPAGQWIQADDVMEAS